MTGRRCWAVLALVLVTAAGVMAFVFRDTITGWLGGTGASSIPAEERWAVFLVNKDRPVPDDWQVRPLKLSNGEVVDERIYPHLQRMFDDARAQGIQPTVRAGYRDEAAQQELLDRKIAELTAQGMTPEEVRTEAESWVAPPGTSEHQLGIAVDINAQDQAAKDEVYAWFAAHAHQYGFILRYPEEKSSVTGINHEPWHYRYVGPTAARLMVEHHQTLEEFLGDT